MIVLVLSPEDAAIVGITITTYCMALQDPAHPDRLRFGSERTREVLDRAHAMLEALATQVLDGE